MEKVDRSPILHKLKIHPEPFAAWRNGFKRSEYRKDDRDFQVGDRVQLHEFDSRKKKKPYTGRALEATISHKQPGGKFGVPKGYCVLCLHSPKFLSPSHHETPEI